MVFILLVMKLFWSHEVSPVPSDALFSSRFFLSFSTNLGNKRLLKKYPFLRVFIPASHATFSMDELVYLL